MAAELLGGSLLSACLQVMFDRIISREVVDFFRQRKIDHRQLEKLEIAMNAVNALLDDAEEKQITKQAVAKWLDDLKDAIYEADDLVDEMAYEALQQELHVGSQSSSNQVQNLFSYFNPFRGGNPANLEITTKLEEILDKLRFLLGQKDVLGLKECCMGEKPSSLKILTTSLVDESSVYGRDEDKEAIIKLLLSDHANGNGIGVIPIVGMGGIGKTTLAQLVFNDSRVEDLFDLKSWVCYPEDFDIFKVTKDFLKEITNDFLKEISSFTFDSMTPNQLQLELKKKLIGKQFLLVLDDVWNDKYADWDDLQRIFKYGAKGSKVIVTTRNVSVSSMMGTLPTQHLKELSDEDSWFLLSKHAFADGDSSARPDLEVIGREIVKKCKGLPLATKALGGLLRSKRDTNDWEKISKSRVWDLSNDSILPALRLSYRYLPSHLKRCFAYCAIFPKDCVFNKEELILLWMAEGFLDQTKGNKDMKEVGDEYFQDLVSRSFFQLSSVDPSSFLMHDLLNELAKFVSGEFCFVLEGNDSRKIGKRTRHLLYSRTKYDAHKKFEGFYAAQHLRTFLSVEGVDLYKIDSNVTHDLIPSLMCLRVLSLSQYYNIVELPDSIGNLKHLRYLDLSGTSIKRLPEYLGRLYYLQTLILYGCINLLELPTEIVRLINLSHLDIRETALKEMPSKMGKLTKLESLTDFFLGKERGSSIKELGTIHHLQGELCIWNLQNVVNAQDAMEAHLEGKKHLKKLMLRWDGDTNNSLHERAILEQLQPHRNLEDLSIIGYGGTRFPDWVGDSCFSNIVSLELNGSNYCSCLAPLGQLASLKCLKIMEFDGVLTVGSEFYGSCTSMKKTFGSLETLEFKRMQQWCEWISLADQAEGGAFPLLQELYIIECPRLKKALPGDLPSLKTLVIEGCPQLVASLPRAPTILEVNLKDDSFSVLLEKLPSELYSLSVDKIHCLDSLVAEMEKMHNLSNVLEKFEMRNCVSLKCFQLELFPKLKTLKIHDCPYFESLFAHDGSLGDFTSLSSLEIKGCPKLACFQKGGLAVPNLTKLSLQDCSNLKSLPERMHFLLPSLVHLQVRNCPGLELFPEGGLSSKLESLDIESCSKLIAGRMHWNLQILPSLSAFRIGGYGDVESFPEDILLPSSITSLRIWDLKNLKTLDYKGLQHLSSLKELRISDCPELQFLPKEGLPSSLSSLFIYNSPKLEPFPAVGLPSKLESLEILRCDKLIASYSQWAVERLPPLLHFTIGMHEDVESFPGDFFLPSTLTSLRMWNLQNLKSLDDKGLQRLTCLREMDIWECPQLQSIPKEGLPSSLSSICVYKCPLLKERYEGEDWPSISIDIFDDTDSETED